MLILAHSKQTINSQSQSVIWYTSTS